MTLPSASRWSAPVPVNSYAPEATGVRDAVRTGSVSQGVRCILAGALDARFARADALLSRAAPGAASDVQPAVRMEKMLKSKHLTVNLALWKRHGADPATLSWSIADEPCNEFFTRIRRIGMLPLVGTATPVVPTPEHHHSGR